MPNFSDHLYPVALPDRPTPVEIKDYSVDLLCWCNRCSHNGVVEIDLLIAHCGPLLAFPSVHGLLRCQACGSKDIAARPNWRGLGVVARHEPVNTEFCELVTGE